jgi:hypothetical protein
MISWQFRYLPHIVCPELPVEMNSFKTQQFRWAKGLIQTGIKLATANSAKQTAAENQDRGVLSSVRKHFLSADDHFVTPDAGDDRPATRTGSRCSTSTFHSGWPQRRPQYRRFIWWPTRTLSN